MILVSLMIRVRLGELSDLLRRSCGLLLADLAVGAERRAALLHQHPRDLLREALHLWNMICRT